MGQFCRDLCGELTNEVLITASLAQEQILGRTQELSQDCRPEHDPTHIQLRRCIGQSLMWDSSSP